MQSGALDPLYIPHVPTGFEMASATLADLDALVALEKKSFVGDQISRRSFRRWLGDTQDILLLARQGERLAGYILILCHRGTRLARIYSLAVDPDFRGQGIAAWLIHEGEQRARDSGRLHMRLEVSSQNASAIRLYESLGYKQFGLYHDYYEDHSDALRYQKRIRIFHGDAQHSAIPWLAQNTNFTCGPASLMMALAAFDKDYQPSLQEELRLWREATTIFMTSGHGGCHPMGLALAAQARGFTTSVWVSQTGPLFLDGVRDETKKPIMTAVHNDFCAQLQALHVPVRYRDLRQQDLIDAFKEGAVPLILISTYRMDSKKAPHWVVMSGYDDDCIYVHDPDPEGGSQTSLDCQFIPLARSDFELMTSFGRNRLRTAVIVHAKKTP
jgi:ribosomal protein S18 acetylase RimI-like enzyme